LEDHDEPVDVAAEAEGIHDIGARVSFGHSRGNDKIHAIDHKAEDLL